MTWKPWLGAVPDAAGTHFRVWAPKVDAPAETVPGGPTVPLRRDAEGYFTGRADGVRSGARYFYRFPDGRERPDPASLLQPQGVHGPSEIVDLAEIAPRSARARVPLEKLIFCEIHLGTYTVEGTADAAARYMPELAEALYTAVEVMPVAAFAGPRNWGYDGVAPFAAQVDYGGPAALARLVDAAHAVGLSAFLDVVYNHLGPEGAYLGEYGRYFTSRHKTPWGDALDFSLPRVRRYFVENALRWVSRAGGGFDGLRLDAIHGIYDDSPTHILQEIAEAVHSEGALVIAESDLNDVKVIERYHLDGSWAARERSGQPAGRSRISSRIRSRPWWKQCGRVAGTSSKASRGTTWPTRSPRRRSGAAGSIARARTRSRSAGTGRCCSCAATT